MVTTGQLYAGVGLGYGDLVPVSSDDMKRLSGTTRGIIPRFFTETRSRKDGSFFDVEMIEMLIPGDSKTVVIRMVDDNVKKRFNRHYADWKAGLSQAQSGTPIELLVGQGSVMHQLKAQHIHTVEQAATLTDGQLDIVMGGRALRDRAQKFLADADRLRKQNEEEADKRTIADLQARLAALESAGNLSLKDIKLADTGIEDLDTPPQGAVPVTGSDPLANSKRKQK